MTNASRGLYPVPMNQVWSLLTFAQNEGYGVDLQRDVVAAIYPMLRPHLVEILLGVVTPSVDTPESLMSRS